MLLPPGWCLCFPGERRGASDQKGKALILSLLGFGWEALDSFAERPELQLGSLAPPHSHPGQQAAVTIFAPGDHGYDAVKFGKSGTTFYKPSWVVLWGYQVRFELRHLHDPPQWKAQLCWVNAPLGIPALGTGWSEEAGWTRYTTKACHKWPRWPLLIWEFSGSTKAVVGSSWLSCSLCCSSHFLPGIWSLLTNPASLHLPPERPMW